MPQRSNLAVDERLVRAGGALAERECQQLWFALARQAWTSIVIVPADRDGSSAALAIALADVGKRISEEPVSAINFSALEYDSARALADLQRHIERARRTPPQRNPRVVEVSARLVTEDDEGEEGTPTARRVSHAVAPAGQVIISIPAVVGEPLGLAVTHSADFVVLSVQMGRTRYADARRTIELIGRERIAGCFVF